MFYSGYIMRRKIFVNVSKISDPEETTICYKISLVQWLVTNLNVHVILYLSTCHTVYISALIHFMIMPYLITNTYVSLMYKLNKNIKVFTSKYVGTGPPSYEKRIYRAAVSQRLRNVRLGDGGARCYAPILCFLVKVNLSTNFSVQRGNLEI